MAGTDPHFPRLIARHDADIHAVNARVVQEFKTSPGRLAIWKEIVWEIGVDRIPDLTDQQIEAEVELAARGKNAGTQLGLLTSPLAMSGHGDGLLRREGEDGYEMPAGVRIVRTIAELYEPRGE